MDEPLVHVMKPHMMLAACGVPRAQIQAANIEASKITCPRCRTSPEFQALTPVVSAMVADDPVPGKKRGKASIRYKNDPPPKQPQKRRA